jgi:hypothetical protein
MLPAKKRAANTMAIKNNLAFIISYLLFVGQFSLMIHRMLENIHWWPMVVKKFCSAKLSSRQAQAPMRLL